MVDVSIQDLTVQNGSESDGGGIFARSTIKLLRCTFVQNRAGFQGGAIWTVAPCTVEECTFRDNSAGTDGGALFLTNGGTITNSVFLTNSARTGGAIYHFIGNLVIEGCKFTDNFTTGSFNDGGALYSAGLASLTVTNSTFERNRTGRYGGAINTQSTGTLTDSRFVGNTAGLGGGAIAVAAIPLTIINSSFSENAAAGIGFGAVVGGGAIRSQVNATVEIRGSALFMNSADELGGAILQEDNGTIRIINSTLAQNTAGDDGGALYVMGGTASLSFTTIANNAAGGGAALATSAEGFLEVKNSIIANTPLATNCAGSIMDLGGNLATDNNCTGFQVVTPAQLNLGPLQINPPGTTETMALLPGSVAIDAALECTDAEGNPVLTDQRGVERPIGANCDVGAFEFQPLPGPPGSDRRRFVPVRQPLFESLGTCQNQRIRRPFQQCGGHQK